MTRHYATAAHAPLSPQLRVLHATMQRHCAPFVLHVLAEGEEVARVADCLPDVEVTNVEDFLAQHPEWAPGRLPGPPRNGNELACAWRWRFVADLLARTGQPVTLVDADVAFWSSPEPVFIEIGDAGVAVVPHVFAPAAAGLPGVTAETHSVYGRHNGGFSVWRDPLAADRMAEYARIWSKADFFRRGNGQQIWGDQSWLSVVCEEFSGHVIEHAGAAPGPWSIHTQPLEKDNDGRVFFGGRPLVAYHYSSLRPGQLADPDYAITAEQERLIYAPYLRALGMTELGIRIGEDLR